MATTYDWMNNQNNPWSPNKVRSAVAGTQNTVNTASAPLGQNPWETPDDPNAKQYNPYPFTPGNYEYAFPTSDPFTPQSLNSFNQSNSTANSQFDMGGALKSKGAFDFGNWLNNERRGAMKSLLENSLFPYAQFNANEQQRSYDNLLNMKNFNMQRDMNQYNMEQQMYQNDFQRWLAEQQNQQFASQFGLDRDVASWRYGPEGIERYGIDQTTKRNTDTLANNLAVQNLINSGQLGQIGARGDIEKALQQMIGSQQLGNIGATGQQERLTQAEGAAQARKLQEFLQAQEMARLREQMAGQLTQSRYAAFGRSQAPNARFAANWG